MHRAKGVPAQVLPAGAGYLDQVADYVLLLLGHTEVFHICIFKTQPGHMEVFHICIFKNTARPHYTEVFHIFSSSKTQLDHREVEVDRVHDCTTQHPFVWYSNPVKWRLVGDSAKSLSVGGKRPLGVPMDKQRMRPRLGG